MVEAHAGPHPLLGCAVDSRSGRHEPARLRLAALPDLDRCSSVAELLLDLGSFVLVDAFFDRLWRLVDQRLGLLEAETGDLADHLDRADLVGATVLEHDGERGLLLGRRCRRPAASGGRCHRNRSRSGDTPARLHGLDELRSLAQAQAVDLLEDVLELGIEDHSLIVRHDGNYLCWWEYAGLECAGWNAVGRSGNLGGRTGTAC